MTTDQAAGALLAGNVRRYPPPSLLVSWVYFRSFQGQRQHYRFRDYSLDSGAYSAFNSGTVIDLPDYTRNCVRLLQEDPQCTEVFALDVVGDWKASASNTEYMWSEGVPAIPVYHIGEPEAALLHMAKTYPKIALGGAGGVGGISTSRKIAWCQQVFARVWPKPIHGLAMLSERLLMSVPFHSADSVTWDLNPAAFGRWNSMPGNGRRASIRPTSGGAHPLRMEVEWYQRLEERVQNRWVKEMSILADMLGRSAESTPTVRLAVAGNSQKIRRGLS